MASLDKQPIRAQIRIGSSLVVETPNVVSFSVSRSRGQMSATFQASIKIPYTSSTDILADKVVIRAGQGKSASSMPIVFTGKVFKAVINPVRTDASVVMLNLSGKDVLSILEGQKINRRLKTYRDGSSPPARWGMINNIVKRNTPAVQQFPVKMHKKEVGVRDWQGNHIVMTPEAFDLHPNPNRKQAVYVRGNLTVTALPKEDKKEPTKGEST